MCTEAVRITTATPDLTDPQAAANTTIGDGVGSLAETLCRTTVDDLVTPPADWLRQKTDQVSALTKACGL